MVPDIRRLPARTQLADDVAAYVRDLIGSGRVPAGEYPRLENLAEQIGTSVTVDLTAKAPKLVRFLENATRFSPRLFFSEIAGWSQASADDHRAVLDAFQAGFADDARTATARHVDQARVLLGGSLKECGPWSERNGEGPR